MLWLLLYWTFDLHRQKSETRGTYWMRVTKKFQKWNQMKTSLNAVVAYSAVGDVAAVCVSRYAVLETLQKMKKTLNWS